MAQAALPAAAAGELQYRCAICGSDLVDASGASGDRAIRPQAPSRISPGDLPTYLAHPWQALWQEPHARIRLHWLLDTAELTVRWIVALVIAEVVHAGAGAIPEQVAIRINEHIERPSLGRWLAILAELTRARPEAPLLAPGVFDLYEVGVKPRFRQERGKNSGGTLETSLLVLRNHAYHGGGMSNARASELLNVHLPGFERLLQAVASAIADCQIVALAGGLAFHLQGIKPPTCAVPLPLQEQEEGGPWLVGQGGALPLLPLARYAPVSTVGSGGDICERPGGPAAQIYVRGDKHRLSYTPVGRDEVRSEVYDVSAFRKLFQLDIRGAHSPGASSGDFEWDSSLREARVVAEDQVGRVEEVTAVKAWVKACNPRKDGAVRVGVVLGGPGVGKSMLMARLAQDLSNTPPARAGMYFHRFRGGDTRNNRRAFMQMFLEALMAWEPLRAVVDTPARGNEDKQELEEEVKARLKAIAGLTPCGPRLPAPTFRVLLDGLDEVMKEAPGLLDLVHRLALPGTVWLLASRPGHGLDEALVSAPMENIFQGGLPPMSPADIRTMLLEGLDHSRHSLLRLDREQADQVRNDFVDRVVECADGFPLYVHLLLEDLRSGKVSVDADAPLPRGLQEYYDRMVGRMGVSDVSAVLPSLVCILARAQEPLDQDALSLLLAGDAEDAELYREPVQSALRAGQALLGQSTTREGTRGWTLYHHSFREYIAGGSGPSEPHATGYAPHLSGTLKVMERRLARMASEWATLPPGNLRNHLFRWGNSYALRWLGASGVKSACDRLTSFPYLQARLAALPATEVVELVLEYKSLLVRLEKGPGKNVLVQWEAFIRERTHILSRGSANWGAHKILLQLAVEHADESPVTRAAEAWLQDGGCDWLWLRRARRPKQPVTSPCVRTIEGQANPLVLSDGTVLSWVDSETSWDKGELSHWSPGDWTCLGSTSMRAPYYTRALGGGRFLAWTDDVNDFWLGSTEPVLRLTAVKGHDKDVRGVRELSDGWILSWSKDGTLRLWAEDGRGCLATLKGHTEEVSGALELVDGRLLSWSEDKTLRLWSQEAGTCLATLEGHAKEVTGAIELADGRLLSWSYDETLRLWSSDGCHCLGVLKGHEREVDGAVQLKDGRVLSWSWDATLRIWSLDDLACQAVLEGHTEWVTEILILSNGNILSWSDDETELRLWSVDEQECVAVLEGHTEMVGGAIQLADGRILSWSWDDPSIRLWSAETGEPDATLEGHTEGPNGAIQLADGQVVSWSTRDQTMRIWSVDGDMDQASLEGHNHWVKSGTLLSSGCLLTWSEDHTLRIWSMPDATCLATLAGHTDDVWGALELSDGRIASWADDDTVRIWSASTGASLVCLRAPTHIYDGVVELSNHRLLTWAYDARMQLWAGDTGQLLASMEGHTGKINRARVLKDGRILSLSEDKTLRLWSQDTGECLAVLEGHEGSVGGGREFENGRIVSWDHGEVSWDPGGWLFIWPSEEQPAFAAFKLKLDIDDVLELQGGRIAVWSHLYGGEHVIHIRSLTSTEDKVTLRGHTGAVQGVVELRDGRLLSWSQDETLRLWSAETGEHLACFHGHEIPIWDAVELADGQILSWSKYTLRLWSPAGEPVDNWDLRSAPHEVPDLWTTYVGEVDEGQVCEPGVGGATGTSAHICLAGSSSVTWQGDGEWGALALTADGTLAAFCVKDVAFLQLHLGNKRISLDEACQLLGTAKPWQR